MGLMLNEYRDTMPYEPSNLEEQAQRMRDHEGDDYALMLESEAGREFGALAGLLSWPGLLSAAVTVGAVAALVILVTMGSAL